MKLAFLQINFLTGLFVALAASAAEDDVLQVHENFLTWEEVEQLRETNMVDEDSEGIFYGATFLPKKILDRLSDPQQDAFICHKCGVAVMTQKIIKTTPRHNDYHIQATSMRLNQMVEDDVGFIFLNSNENAKFVHCTTEVSV